MIPKRISGFLGTILLASSFANANPIEWTTSIGGNGHAYEAIRIPAGITWTAARTMAESREYKGYRGYLATLTTPSENDFVFTSLASDLSLWNGQGPFLGGFRNPSDIDYIRGPQYGWHWVTGEMWSYTSWAEGEPNAGFSIPTDYLQFFIDTRSSSGLPSPYWNDTFDQNPNQSQPVLGFIVEYNVPEPGTSLLLVAFPLLTHRRHRC